MWSPFHNPERSTNTERASAPARRAAAALWSVALLVVAAASACTQIQVEETHVKWQAADSCEPASDGGRGGGGQNPQLQSGAVMDTYIVEIFELTNPEGFVPNDCETCLATRENCFIEEASCVCGDQVPVSLDHLHHVLAGVRVGLPVNHISLYCLRVMAVQRTSESESCACDADWQRPERIRLCALSDAYAASPLPPIDMQVQCDANDRLFQTCVGNTGK